MYMTGYNGDGASNATWALEIGFNIIAVQSFKALYTGKLTSVMFYVRNSTGTTGNAYAVLYAHSGTYGTDGVPTGSVLATSNPINVSTLPGSFSSVTEFTFTGIEQYEMANETAYCIGVKFEGGNGSGTQYIQVGVDSTSPTHEGNRASYITSWTALTGDQAFFLYATPTRALASRSLADRAYATARSLANSRGIV